MRSEALRLEARHRMDGKVIIVMPAYNAERTLERIVAQIPEGCCDEVIVVDDGSRDRTVEIARRLPVTLIEHGENRGYGANQKTGYRAALESGADYVVMLHPDYQYDARIIPATLDILRLGICDVVLSGNDLDGQRVTYRSTPVCWCTSHIEYDFGALLYVEVL